MGGKKNASKHDNAMKMAEHRKMKMEKAKIAEAEEMNINDDKDCRELQYVTVISKRTDSAAIDGTPNESSSIAMLFQGEEADNAELLDNQEAAADVGDDIIGVNQEEADNEVLDNQEAAADIGVDVIIGVNQEEADNEVLDNQEIAANERDDVIIGVNAAGLNMGVDGAANIP